jgi:voltage-gated potassium channel
MRGAYRTAVREAVNAEHADLMEQHMALTFVKEFDAGLWLALPLISFLAIIIAGIGPAVGAMEGWSRFDTLYSSFITRTTARCGGIRPVRPGSRILAVLVAFLGLILTGIVVAIALRASAMALQVVRP